MPDKFTYNDLVAIHRAVEAYANETFPNRPDNWFKDIVWGKAAGLKEQDRMWKRVKAATGLTGNRAKTAAMLHFADLAEEAINA